MQTQTALETRPQPASTNSFIVEAEKLLDRMQELSQDITRRAYEFFQARGGELGHALDDWFRAESELLRPVPVELIETETHVALRAEVPGFKADEIKVSVEPRRLIISGESARQTEEQTAQTIYNERHSSQICRAIDLPVEVDPQRASARLKDGVLELTLDKATNEAAVNVQVKAA